MSDKEKRKPGLHVRDPHGPGCWVEGCDKLAVHRVKIGEPPRVYGLCQEHFDAGFRFVH